ncbi:Rieske (2Fe-2S) protein [Rhodococcus sp. WS3]|uniref:Rieske (2Fe-2S) protein n=1 Tax=Rhodococcus sp. WS3 TaxID=2486271 RepID=UPI0011415A57|nr:Rieske (2Fe-2S) protein [Rhodococcus sp. WS3]ROZ49006.1 Rieske (2Fe-2S) protein [Rhodococcus sp. WS3]
MKAVVCHVKDLPVNERKIVTVGSRSIGVFNIDGEYYAISNRCPHQGGPLCLGRQFSWAESDVPGEVEVEEASPQFVACPWHGWEYDVKTGQSFMGPAEVRVKAYDVAVANGAALSEGVAHAEEQRVSDATARAAGREPGPYVAETFSVHVEADYVVIEI